MFRSGQLGTCHSVQHASLLHSPRHMLTPAVWRINSRLLYLLSCNSSLALNCKGGRDEGKGQQVRPPVPGCFLAHTCSVILRARHVSLVVQPQAMKGFGSNPTVLHIFDIIRYCQKYSSYHLCWSTYPSYFLYMRINSFPGSGSALVRFLRLPGGFLLSKRLRDVGASRNKHKFPACWQIGSNKEGEINVRGLTSDIRSAGRRASVSMLQRHSQLLPRQQSSANLLFSEPPDVKKGVNWHVSPRPLQRQSSAFLFSGAAGALPLAASGLDEMFGSGTSDTKDSRQAL